MKLNIMLLIVFVTIFQLNFAQINLSPRRGEVVERDFQIFAVPENASFESKWNQVFNSGNNKEIFQEFIEKFIERVQKKKIITEEYYNENLEILMERYGMLYPEIVQEIKVISKISGVDIKKIYLLNFTYEIFANQKACTTIIARKENGDIIMGRNIDYFLEQYYSDLSVQFDYYDQNQNKIYSTQAYIGYVVALTGIRYNKFSISFNQRDSGNLKDNLNNFLSGAYSNQYLIKRVLQKATSYEQALEILRNEKIIASCYYIITGLEQNEGVILERDRESVYNEYGISDSEWFSVVTNYDSDYKDIDGRRGAAIQMLNEIGQQDIDEQQLKEILRTYPVFHKRTITSTIMNNNDNYIESFVWY